MPRTTTTLTNIETKPGSSNGRSWLLSIFKAADGGDFTTFDGGLASKASSLINTPVAVEYDESQNGQYTRRTLKSIEAVGAGEVAVVSGVSERPADALANNPIPAPVYKKASGEFRTKEQIMRTDATNQALTYFGLAGIDPIENPSEFSAWVDTFYKNIEQGTFETPDVRAEATA